MRLSEDFISATLKVSVYEDQLYISIKGVEGRYYTSLFFELDKDVYEKTLGAHLVEILKEKGMLIEN